MRIQLVSVDKLNVCLLLLAGIKYEYPPNSERGRMRIDIGHIVICFIFAELKRQLS